MKYRAEIDGLRALAVVPVILFHAGFDFFSGGFIGVDVFFVISGYLITTIIISELAEDKFSLVNFYERRARRILPALFFVMLVCLPFAWLWLTPRDLQDFGQSLVAVSTFSSNILFWTESGYFETAAELKPLLHTWSLAVEEQYYIIFPVVLILTWRLGVKWILVLCAIAFFVSLGLAQWGAYNKPDATFFLLPTRGWELLIGVFAGFYLKYRTFLKSQMANEVLSLTGLGMIIYAIVAFDDSTPFPSLYALVPTVGTVLLILCAVQNTIAHRVLSFAPFVGIGLISYSAYLWHQPLLAFAHHRAVGDVHELVLLALCAASIGMAYVSWRWVEQPFRNKSSTTRSFVFSFSLIGIVFFSAIGLMLHMTKGLEDLKLKYQLTDAQRSNYELISKSTNYDLYQNMQGSDCVLWYRDLKDADLAEIDACFERHGSPLMVVGDSHAMNIHNIFGKSQQFDFVLSVAQGGCRPHTTTQPCHYEGVLQFLADNRELNPVVVYHQSGSYFIKNELGQLEPNLEDEVSFHDENVRVVMAFLNELEAVADRVYWLGHFTEYRIAPLNDFSRLYDIPDLHFEIFRKLDRDIIEILPGDAPFTYVPFDTVFELPKAPVIEDCFLWHDGDHFSQCGEAIIGRDADLDFLSAR